MSGYQVHCSIVEMPSDAVLSRNLARPREVSPQAEPCVARIVELVARRGRLMRPLDASSRHALPRAEAPPPFDAWWTEPSAPAQRDDGRDRPQD